MKDNKNIIAFFTAPHRIELIEGSIPTLRDDYVLVEYIYCGICGGDYSVYRGNRQSYPVSLGHEFVAKVICVGELVTNIRRGQYVVSDFNYRCGKCIYCANDQTHLCVKNDIGYFSNRGFAKYATIHSSYLIPITPPDYLPRACLIEPLSCVIHACNSLCIQKGMNILICGGGGIGMLFCFLLRKAYEDIHITLLEHNPSKRELINKHFSVQEFNVSANNNYDLIVDCSNSIKGLQFLLDYAQRGSRVCVMSHLYGLETSFVYEQACKKELSCCFPLRNGSRKNLLISAKYIDHYWMSEYDEMITIYEDIFAAFKEKDKNPYCKQIVKSSRLRISELA